MPESSQSRPAAQTDMSNATTTDTRRFMNLTQLLHRSASVNPGEAATMSSGAARTWYELKDRVARLAGALKKLGLKTGDRVAILALNSDAYTEYYFAVWWAGGVVVPLNTRWSARENAYSLNDSGAGILFVDDAFKNMVAEIQQNVAGLDSLIYMGAGACPQGMAAYEALIAGAAPIADTMRAEDDLAGLFYTGGTTGFPKGVMLGHRGLWFNAMLLAKHAEMDAGSVGLHAAPMFHLADGAMGLALSMVAGTHTYVPSFDPEAVLDRIESDQVTHILLVPTMIGLLLNSPAFAPERLRSVEVIAYGASPMPEGLMRAVMDRLPHVRFMQGYGQTEMSPFISALLPDDHALDGPHSGRLKSAGRSAIGCEVKILKEDGTKAAAGEVGEVVARSPGSMLGYWNLPEQTQDVLHNGWVRTGDGGYMDEDGYLYIVDRMKDMIVTGGENVFSAEVESVISTFPGVAAVAVIGIPSEKWGEAVHAIIVSQPDADISGDCVIEHCRKLIANYKVPRTVEVRQEPLPLSAAGKVLKRELRAPYWASRQRSIN